VIGVKSAGVLIVGVYGTGKTSVCTEIAEVLEAAGVSYGAIDLDWLGWYDAELDDRPIRAVADEILGWLGWA
jgi:Mrp family chromosome partitioning ATPase